MPVEKGAFIFCSCLCKLGPSRIIQAMTERLTSDVPAIPDLDFISYDPDYYARNPRSLRAFLESHDSETVPLRDPTEVQDLFNNTPAKEFIADIAVYQDSGALDIEMSSRVLGIPVVYDTHPELTACHGHITGLPPNVDNDELLIHINPDSDSKPQTFGHEVGHFYYRVILGKPYRSYSSFEEDFCEYFGAQMALPKWQAEGLGEISEAALLELMARSELSLRDTIYQLQEYGILPPRVAVDSFNGKVRNLDFSEKVTRDIACKHCKDTGGDLNCYLAGTDAPLFDFTDRNWGGSIGGCCGEDLHTPEIVSTLTKHYQRLGRKALAETIEPYL